MRKKAHLLVYGGSSLGMRTNLLDYSRGRSRPEYDQDEQDGHGRTIVLHVHYMKAECNCSACHPRTLEQIERQRQNRLSFAMVAKENVYL